MVIIWPTGAQETELIPRTKTEMFIQVVKAPVQVPLSRKTMSSTTTENASPASEHGS